MGRRTRATEGQPKTRFMARVNRQLREDPDFRRQCRHQRLILEVTELMCSQNYHAIRRRKMEEYLDLLWDLGFTVARRKKKIKHEPKEDLNLIRGLHVTVRYPDGR